MTGQFDHIYLFDHAASTPDRTNQELDFSSLAHLWGSNPHSIHKSGLYANKILQECENIIKDHINGHDGKIIWTQNGSTANSLIIKSVCCTGELIGSNLEHKSITQWYRNLLGYKIPVLETGFIDVETFKTEFTFPVADFAKALVCIQAVNNETGKIQPILDVSKFLKGREDTYLHVDAVQALGRLNIDVRHIGCDSISLSAHKAYGPKGIGCLWVSNRVLDDIEITIPYTGTPSLELAQRFAQAINKLDIAGYTKRQQEKETIFIQTLEKELVYGLDFELTTGPQNKVPGILSVVINDVDADELSFLLSQHNIFVSTGSACNGKTTEPSAVLTAMGISKEQIASTIRVSFGDAASHYSVLAGTELMAKLIKELKDGS